MDSILFIYVIVGLFAVIFAEFAFLLFVLDRSQKEKDRLVDELAKANTAIIAKSANDYAMMRAMDNTPVERKKDEPQGVDVTELSDTEYDEMLKNQLK